MWYLECSNYSLIHKNGYTFASVYSSKCVTVFLNQTIYYELSDVPNVGIEHPFCWFEKVTETMFQTFPCFFGHVESVKNCSVGQTWNIEGMMYSMATVSI